MKRTAELVLGILGTVFIAFGILLMIGVTSIFNVAGSDEQIQQEIMEEMQNDPTLSAADVQNAEELVELVSSFSFGITISFVISAILGLIATIFVKKKTKVAGILFIIGGVIGLLSIIPAVLYVVAGIMALARKAPPVEQPVETV
ncbi:DUF4064 domain-containing protein [Alkalicoccobacillus plakortidis]|uniref:DUF4064 domain-containing protein n=1 Tax=Alkalicoccobacillus plakortidis TaxID=444060 RepID=A0ABT0XK11_9BACI|nr:DUF4064 domain-containing protein [Alkalicoccobacillus plakortidis]MCM2676045.1 DUF4064 domain-containing protein [Alkalicoccobacillus plakortidis]